jgi:hypothetical protein
LKIVRIFLLSLLSLVLLFAAAGFYFGFKHSESVKEAAIIELNKLLKSKVEVKNIDFSVFKKFPYASLEFDQVVMFEPFEGSVDTLFFSKNVSLHFNIIDIWNENYNLKKITFGEGFAKPKVYKNGSDNFHFWKENKDAPEGDLSLKLKDISIEKFNLDYQDMRDGHYYSAYIKKSALKGNFSSSDMNIGGSADLFAENIVVSNVSYVYKQPVRTKFLLDINGERCKIKNSELIIAGMSFDVSGDIKFEEDKNIDIAVKGKNLDIQSFLSLLPEHINKHVKDYQSKGGFYFDLSLSGPITEKQAPSLKAEFGISKGNIYHSGSSVSLEQVECTGYFKTHDLYKAESGILELKEISATFRSGSLKGNLSIQNFLEPVLALSFITESDLTDLTDFLKVEKISNIKGSIHADITFSGKLRNNRPEDFNKAKTSGKIFLRDVDFYISDGNQKHKNINAELLLDNNDIIIKNLSGIFSESDYILKGFARNILSYVFSDNGRLVVDASLESQKIDLNKILAGNSRSEKDTVYDFHFPENADWYLSLYVGELTFRRFHARNISGKANLKDRIFVTEKLLFESLDGKAEISGIADASSDNIMVKCYAGLSEMDIEKMFYQFENFGQEFIQNKHIKGIVSADMLFTLKLNQKLEIDNDELTAKADILIEKGELIKFGPLKNLSSFIKVSELEHIKFSTLKNSIEIKDRKIYIPQMDINSSALNIGLSGVHSFDDKIDYRFRFLLSDVLSQKAKTQKPENTEFGFIENDERKRMSIFIAMTGTVDNPKISYDGAALKAKMKEDVTAEKQTVKALLKDEFGLYKKDTALNTPKHHKPVNLQIEWEEMKKDSSGQEKKLPAVKTETKEKGKFGKWIDKVAPENKKEFETTP